MNLAVNAIGFVTTFIKQHISFLLLGTVLTLQGCGGGGGGGTPANNAPVAVADTIAVDEGATVTVLGNGAGSVLGNDTDEDGDSLTAVKVTDPANGTLTFNSDGTFSYTHDGSETSTDSFTYKANDGTDDSNTVTVSINITLSTVLVNDAGSVLEDAAQTTVSGNVLSNDVDPEVTLTVTNAAALNGSGTYGSLIIDVTGAYTYTLENGRAVTNALAGGVEVIETYTYIANGQSADLVITVTGADDATVLSADAASITEDAVPNTTGGNVLGNDFDPDTTLSVTNATSLNTTGVYGSLNISSNGAWTYTLDNGRAATNALTAGEEVTETYTYNANGLSANLVITITGVNDVAVLSADAASITEDAVPNTTSGNVLTNDTDPDTTLSVSNTGALNGTGTYGSISIGTDGAWTYTLDNARAVTNALAAGVEVTETYTYDANGQSTDLVITITGADDAAVLSDDAGSVTEDDAVTTAGGNVLTNDSDVDSALSVTNAATLNGAGTYGSLSIDSTGAYTYTLDNSRAVTDALTAGEVVTETYTYNANGLSANLVITITGADDATVLSADADSITEDAVPNTVNGNVLSNDNDPDTVLTVTNSVALNGTGTYGSLSIGTDGVWTYTLDNGRAVTNALAAGVEVTETYTYDTNGQSADLVITITGADDAAVLSDDAGSVTEDDAVTTAGGNVLTNDSDVDSTLSVTNAATLNGTGTYGSLSIDSTGVYTYTLDNGRAVTNALAAGVEVTETYIYNANGQPANLVITITGADDATVLSDDAGSITEDDVPNTVSGNILSNDNDPDTILTVSNAAALNGTGTYGSLSISGDGAWTYTLDNTNPDVDALNTGDLPLTETYAYNANGQSANLVITINGATDGALIDISGTWTGPSVVVSDSGGCTAGLGTIDNSAISFTQTGSTLTAVTSNGSTLTGTINQVTGDFSFPMATNIGALTGTRPDLSQVNDDTAVNNWSVDVEVTGTATAGGLMSGTISGSVSTDGVPTCTFSQTFTDSALIHQHSGAEDYNGVYTTEGISEAIWVDVFGGSESSIEQETFPVQFEITGSTINFWGPNPSDSSIVSKTIVTLTNTYDPATGFFTLETDEVVKRDIDSDTVVDLTETFHSKITGIFVADPAVTNGSNGSPLMIFNHDGYGRNYAGDKDAGGTPTSAGLDSGPGYAKRVNTAGITRTVLAQRGNLTEESRILIGVKNAPLKVVDTVNSKLYVEILDGDSVATSTSVMCSGPYFDQPGANGRFFIQADLPNPDVDALNFRTNNTATTVNCDASSAGAVNILTGTPLTVRILDTGPNGIKDTVDVTLAGDDVETIFAVTTDVAPIADRYTQNTNLYDINVNGATSSVTQRDSTNRLRGYFNGTQPITVSWPAHPETTTRYQLRLSETGGVVKERINTDLTTTTIPANTIGAENRTLELRAINDTSGSLARAHSRKLEFFSGIRGAFNVEVNHPNFTFGVFEVSMNGNGTNFGCVIRKPVDPNVLSCTGGSIDFATDTITVNLIMNNTTPATLSLVFSDAVTATASLDDGFTISTGNATLSIKEFRARSVVTFDGILSTLFSMQLPNRNQGILSSLAGQDMGAGPGVNFDMWLDNYDARLRSYYELPMSDLIPQDKMTFISNNMASMLAADTFTLTMQNMPGDPGRLRYIVDYAALDPTSLYTPGELPPLRSGITLNGVVVPANAGSANPVDLTANSGLVSTLSWANNLADAANTRFQIRVRIRDSFSGAPLPHDQFRSTRLANGEGGLTLSGDSTTWTWTNPTGLALPPGATADVEIIASDVDNVMWGRSQRFFVTMP